MFILNRFFFFAMTIILFASHCFSMTYISSVQEKIWRHDNNKRIVNHPPWVRKFQDQAITEGDHMKYLAASMQAPNASVTICIQAGINQNLVAPFSQEFSQSADSNGELIESRREFHIINHDDTDMSSLEDSLQKIKERNTGKSFDINIFQCKECGHCKKNTEKIKGVVDTVFKDEESKNIAMHSKSILPTIEESVHIPMPLSEISDNKRIKPEDAAKYLIGSAVTLGAVVLGYVVYKGTVKKPAKVSAST